MLSDEQMRRKDGHLPYISIPNDLNDNQMGTWLRVEHWSDVVLFNDELVDIGDWSVGISWDRCHKLHCLMCRNPVHSLMWKIFSIRPDVSQLHQCPSLLFRSNSPSLRKSDCQRVCLFFVAFNCGVL